MIYYAPTGQAVTPAIVATQEAQANAIRTYSLPASGEPPEATDLTGEEGDAVEIKPGVQDVVEEFDWSNPRTQREFIQLEQKVLAKKADREEVLRYQGMKRERNSVIFAERALRDYAEIQRLRKLAEKLAEVQRYLRPLNIG